jgi:multiple sugar transport system permease protein
VICFAFSGNEFIFALFMTSKKAQPIVVVIDGVDHTQGIQFWFVTTRLLFAIIPPPPFWRRQRDVTPYAD